MGFAVCYRSTRPVGVEEADGIKQAANTLSRGHTWLGCEPVKFFSAQDDGSLFGGSKPNFQPHPDDAAAADRMGMPNGAMHDLLDILCQLSRDHRIDWEISHDHSGGPVGYVRAGACDEAVAAKIEVFADLGDVLGDLSLG
jgi:hypothetical protein